MPQINRSQMIELTCCRCGHVWMVCEKTVPSFCPACKSRHWNKGEAEFFEEMKKESKLDMNARIIWLLDGSVLLMIFIFQLLTCLAIIFILLGILFHRFSLVVIGLIKIMISIIFGGLLGWSWLKRIIIGCSAVLLLSFSYYPIRLGDTLTVLAYLLIVGIEVGFTWRMTEYRPASRDTHILILNQKCSPYFAETGD